MSDDGPYNPFLLLAELLRRLRRDFLQESGILQDAALMTPRVGELLSGIAGLVDECERLRRQLDDLGQYELDAWRAFRKAQERV